MSQERRLPIADFSDYEVSDAGIVYSRRPGNNRGVRRAWRVLPGSVYKHNGYRHVLLAGDGCTRDVLVHVLVLEAFVGPKPEGMQTRHLNGDRLDNRLENLCWGTAKENAADRDRHGTHLRGERAPGSKPTDEDVLRIRLARRRGERGPRLAREFGISKDYLYKVSRGVLWKHLPGATPRLKKGQRAE